MSAIKIEKNVPMFGLYSKYPLAEMKVGDSFAIPVGKHDSVRAQSQKRNKSNAKFSIRKLADGTYRCWRIA